MDELKFVNSLQHLISVLQGNDGEPVLKLLGVRNIKALVAALDRSRVWEIMFVCFLFAVDRPFLFENVVSVNHGVF